MGATCAKPSPQFPSLGVFFERDPSASFSASRLQLECVLVLARLSGRFLALPPSSVGDVHEERVWSLSHLSSCAPVFLGWNGTCPPNALRVDASLAEVTVDELPKDRHWTFGAEASSLNFRRLRLPKESLAAAETFLSDCFELTAGHLAAGQKALRSLGLKKHAYIALHLQMKDFDAGETRARLVEAVERHCSGLPLPFLISSEASEDDYRLRELLDCFSAARVVRSSLAYDNADGACERVALNLLLCRWGARFMASSSSTFSSSVVCMRRRDAQQGPALETQALFLSGSDRPAEWTVVAEPS
jgi:hypothetical protein